MEDISAGEINKYTYCPYQWLYVRTHGEKELRARYKELHPGEGRENPGFVRGRAFHERFGRYEKLKRALAWGLALAAVIALCAAAVYMLQ